MAALVVVALLAVGMVALQWLAERRIEDAPVDGSVEGGASAGSPRKWTRRAALRRRRRRGVRRAPPGC